MKGHIIGLVDEKGNLEMRYLQINKKVDIMTGVCLSEPEIMSDGKIRLHETWEWTAPDNSRGKSIIEEV